ncbi:LOW QUALITY PROTEIN: hypothetical protein CFOL_v3_01181, partial [Cephalotus follicularis]
VYEKPYSRWIDELRMPLGDQPQKFQLFDIIGSPKQHVAHFIKTCNKAATYGDSTVGIPKLANTKQRKDELVVDYIERWRNLVLNCKERISEASFINMCVQGMHWGLLYSIKSNMPLSFEELATRAHDLELQIARRRSEFQLSPEKKELKKYVKKEGKFEKSKEAMTITTSPIQISPKKNGKLTLKELEEKDYPFLDYEVPDILDQLLKQKVIELPTPKCPEEARRVNDPKYCRYHIVSHPLEKCFILKDLILQL